jgi:DNA processing protein
VLGWGIDVPLEAEDQKLANEIISSGGLILSEWTDQKGALWTFPRRNRIVAAIAQEIIVVEAALKSGSLITAELGHKLGKKVWAVPGQITSSVSAGTNMLIKSGQAEMWLPNLSLHPSPESGEGNGKGEVVMLLQNEPLDASEIARKLGQSIEKIGAELSMLVLSGAIIERGGKYYVGEN